MNGGLPKRLTILVAIVWTGAIRLFASSAAAAEEILNYVRVNEVVATGGQPTVPQIFGLEREGFRAIVNLREDSEFDVTAEADAARDAGLIYIRIPVKGAEPNDREVEEFLRVTDDRANYPLFIHCASGNRVGAFWLIRRVLRDGRTFEEARTEAVRIGLKNQNLVDFARAYVAAHAPGS